MKKFLIGGIVVALLVAGVGAFFVYQVVSAQTPPPEASFGDGWQMGRGERMMGDGIMHDAMLAVFAEKLGLTADSLQDRLDDGDSLWLIAEEQDWTLEQYRLTMIDARNQAIDQALEAGKITESQAEWMKSRSENMQNGCGGVGGMTGRMMHRRGW